MVPTYYIQKSSLLQNCGTCGTVTHVTDFPAEEILLLKLEVLGRGKVTASKSCFGTDLVSTVNVSTNFYSEA